MLAHFNINPLYLHLSLFFFKMLSHGLALESQSNHMKVSEKNYSHFTDAEVEAEPMSNDLPKVNWWRRRETTRARTRLPTVYPFPRCCPGLLRPVSSKTGYATRSPRSHEEGTPLSRPHLLLVIPLGDTHLQSFRGLKCQISEEPSLPKDRNTACPVPHPPHRRVPMPPAQALVLEKSLWTDLRLPELALPGDSGRGMPSGIPGSGHPWRILQKNPG